jgi:hypothetical protein
VLAWKTTENAKWANDHLWSQVDPDSHDSDDTYVNRIINEVLKIDERTVDNCAFVIAIIDLMFDLNISTTTLPGELIIRRMAEKAEERELALMVL